MTTTSTPATTPTVQEQCSRISRGIIAALPELSRSQLLVLAVTLRRLDLQEHTAHPHDSVWGSALEPLKTYLDEIELGTSALVDEAARSQMARLKAAELMLGKNGVAEFLEIAEEQDSGLPL